MAESLTKDRKEEMFDAVHLYWSYKNSPNIADSINGYAEEMCRGMVDADAEIQSNIQQLERGKKLWGEGYRIGYDQYRSVYPGSANRDRDFVFAKCLRQGHIATAEAYRWHYLIKEENNG